MVDAEPTLEMYFKRYIQKHSTTRISWNDEKKQAAKKGVKTDAEFKKGLGKELDKLLSLGLATQDLGKHYQKTDKKMKEAVAAVKKQQGKVAKIVGDYRIACQKGQKSPFTPDAQKPAWKDLESELNRVENNVREFLRPILKT